MVKNSPTKENLFAQTKKAIISHFKSDNKATLTKSPSKSPPKTAMINIAKISTPKVRSFKAGPIQTFGQAKKQKASESPIKSFVYVKSKRCHQNQENIPENNVT